MNQLENVINHPMNQLENVIKPPNESTGKCN